MGLLEDIHLHSIGAEPTVTALSILPEEKQSDFTPVQEKTRLNEDLTHAKRTVEFYKVRRADAKTGRIEPKFEVGTLIEELRHLNAGGEEHRLKDLREDLVVFFVGEGSDPTTNLKFYKFQMAITRNCNVGGQLVRKAKEDTYNYEYKGVPYEGDSAFQSHLVIFEDGIAAFEYCQFGPKLNALEDFIVNRLQKVGYIKFQRCICIDHKKNLEKTRITSVVYTLNPTNWAKYNGLTPSYQLVQNKLGGDISIGSIQVIERAKRNGTLAPVVEDVLGKLAGNTDKTGAELGKHLMAAMKGFVRFNGPNQRAVNRNAVHLFEQHITKVQEIEYQKPIKQKVVIPDAAFAALVAAYGSMKRDVDLSITYDEAYK